MSVPSDRSSRRQALVYLQRGSREAGRWSPRSGRGPRLSLGGSDGAADCGFPGPQPGLPNTRPVVLPESCRLSLRRPVASLKPAGKRKPFKRPSNFEDAREPLACTRRSSERCPYAVRSRKYAVVPQCFLGIVVLPVSRRPTPELLCDWVSWTRLLRPRLLIGQPVAV